jgi:hypothetical protein
VFDAKVAGTHRVPQLPMPGEQSVFHAGNSISNCE